MNPDMGRNEALVGTDLDRQLMVTPYLFILNALKILPYKIGDQK